LTPRRYDAYRGVRTEFELLTQEALTDDEKALLLDVAEGLLLARDGDDDEVDGLRTKAAVALSLLVGLGRWSDTAADAVWERLVACGPLDGGPARPARTVQHV
jgi:hypothetical protein